jgi:hypothetical protein
LILRRHSANEKAAGHRIQRPPGSKSIGYE